MNNLHFQNLGQKARNEDDQEDSKESNQRGEDENDVSIELSNFNDKVSNLKAQNHKFRNGESGGGGNNKLGLISIFDKEFEKSFLHEEPSERGLLFGVVQLEFDDFCSLMMLKINY